MAQASDCGRQKSEVDQAPAGRAVGHPRGRVAHRPLTGQRECRDGERPEAEQDQEGDQPGDPGPGPGLAGASFGGDDEASAGTREQGRGRQQVGRHPDQLEHQRLEQGRTSAGQQSKGDPLGREGAHEPWDEFARRCVDRQTADQQRSRGQQQEPQGAPGVEPTEQRLQVAQPLSEGQPAAEQRVVAAQHLHGPGAPAHPLGHVLAGVGRSQPAGQHLVVVDRPPAATVQLQCGVDVLGQGLGCHSADLAQRHHPQQRAGTAPEGGVPAVPSGGERSVEQLLLHVSSAAAPAYVLETVQVVEVLRGLDQGQPGVGEVRQRRGEEVPAGDVVGVQDGDDLDVEQVGQSQGGVQVAGLGVLSRVAGVVSGAQGGGQLGHPGTVAVVQNPGLVRRVQGYRRGNGREQDLTGLVARRDEHRDPQVLNVPAARIPDRPRIQIPQVQGMQDKRDGAVDL